jgi:hypothetical protein
MITDADFDRFLLMSGHSIISVMALRPTFDRWRRQLEARGHTAMPALHSQRPEDAEVINLLTLFALQASSMRDGSKEHRLRNLTEIRPQKP